MKLDGERMYELREECKRLQSLPRDEQRRIVLMYHADSLDKEIPRRERQIAKERAMILGRFLRVPLTAKVK